MLTEDAINPPHYRAPGTPDATWDYPVECIDVVERLPFCLGNAIKYIWRCGRKPGADPVEDLQKATWYLQRQKQVVDFDKCSLPVGDRPCEDFEIAEAMTRNLGHAFFRLWPFGRVTSAECDIGAAIKHVQAEIDRLEAEREADQ